jgi:hypothetical protein
MTTIQQVNAALADFGHALEADLQDAAREGVRAELLRRNLPFDIIDFTVDVHITSLHLSLNGNSAAVTPAKPKRAAKPKPAATRTPAKRPRSKNDARGKLHKAILAAVTQPMTIDEIRAELTIPYTTTNLHQQLYRLTRTGRIRKIDRGHYAPAETNPAGQPTP